MLQTEAHLAVLSAARVPADHRPRRVHGCSQRLPSMPAVSPAASCLAPSVLHTSSCGTYVTLLHRHVPISQPWKPRCGVGTWPAQAHGPRSSCRQAWGPCCWLASCHLVSSIRGGFRRAWAWYGHATSCSQALGLEKAHANDIHQQHANNANTCQQCTPTMCVVLTCPAFWSPCPCTCAGLRGAVTVGVLSLSRRS